MTDAAPSRETSFDAIMSTCGVSDSLPTDEDALYTDELRPRPMGRPTKLTPEVIAQAKAYAFGGATDREIARYLSIDLSTYYRWKQSSVEFREEVKLGKDAADEQVEHALYERARGYEVEVEKLIVVQGELVRETVTEFFPPHEGAALNWLKNRQPDKWRDKTDVSVSLTLESLLTASLAPPEPPAIEGTATELAPDKSNGD